MPSNYETLRDYADAKTHFLDQRKEAGFDSGTEEQFFEWLHAEYVPPKPKPLTIPQRRAVDIAHAIFTCAVSNQETDTFSANGVRALPLLAQLLRDPMARPGLRLHHLVRAEPSRERRTRPQDRRDQEPRLQVRAGRRRRGVPHPRQHRPRNRRGQRRVGVEMEHSDEQGNHT